MNYRCKCGDAHEFTKFESFPTVWGGRTSIFESTCLYYDKHMILVSNTYPPSVTNAICPDPKHRKYIRVSVLMDWDQFMQSGWIHDGEIKKVSS